MTAAVALILGCLLDAVLGEPRRAHPLVFFGKYAAGLERRLNRVVRPLLARACGVLALLLAIAPFVAMAWWLARVPLGWLADAVLLYVALGARSLGEHARAIAIPLASGELAAARAALSRIVSRDTSGLDTQGVAAATLESVLENGNDAVFGALFWFALLGGPGAVLFRLANTLDAMWGYRTPRFLYFGWAAARFDDALNYVPARLTALSYALLGEFRQALGCWRSQAAAWDSPNAGPVMAAGAGALGVRLGGPARYHGAWEARPLLGCGARPVASDIERAIRLVRSTQLLWCVLICAALGLKVI
ncbi:adenosylcobinamide-phosphate synthase CbiB [Uliginosibacterium sp. H3]|uniref:Cobalamin biosynthesis protein CobD n=1 Tax=Uliginosibacterium silvisoli TaxID=3114758 RepID=A0ABU6JYW8_9RHOO|nr:adenosylcobinamide-phosphate synthase CbiB [Uliginosibacterium sp. H3]